MGDHLEVNGHATWIEQRRGTEPAAVPVVLLHGGMSHSGVLLDVLGPALLAHDLVAFDRAGHGRTADRDGPFHYDDMATETIAVLEKIVQRPAHLVGYSDGGIVALLVARARPELVDRLVLIGTNFHHEGLHPVEVDPASPVIAMIAEEYGRLSPDGIDHFATIVQKTLTMFATEPTMRGEDLATIRASALVMAGDDDLVQLAHTCELYESLPESQLAIVPGSSHVVVLEKPDLLARMITDYLDGPVPPVTLMPHRRA